MPTAYEIVTESIIKQLESGVAPWHKLWRTEPPANLVSKKEYRGINIFLLASQGYGSRYWVTYRQAQALGGTVKKGQHGSRVVFWKIDDYRKENNETGETENRKSILLRYYTVFNLEQCERIKSPEPDRIIHPIERCENIVNSMPNRPGFEQDSRAFYRPSTDTVGLPARSAFDCIEAYYSTLFHELTHSTAHPLVLDARGSWNTTHSAVRTTRKRNSSQRWEQPCFVVLLVSSLEHWIIRRLTCSPGSTNSSPIPV
jgi:antirestriction protein ArdC